MAKYQVRINYIAAGCVGEGEFWWFDDESLPQVPESTPYFINPSHWSTMAFELVPCFVLPKLTGKEGWHVSYHSDDPNLVMARYNNDNGDIAIIELCDEKGFISLRWAEEDRIPSKPALTVFTPNGKEIPCDTAKEAAETVCREIFFNCGPNRNAICVKR